MRTLYGPHAPQRGVFAPYRLPIGELSAFYLGHSLGRSSCKLVANLLPNLSVARAGAWNMAQNLPTFNSDQAVVNRLIAENRRRGESAREKTVGERSKENIRGEARVRES